MTVKIWVIKSERYDLKSIIWDAESSSQIELGHISLAKSGPFKTCHINFTAIKKFCVQNWIVSNHAQFCDFSIQRLAAVYSIIPSRKHPIWSVHNHHTRNMIYCCWFLKESSVVYCNSFVVISFVAIVVTFNKKKNILWLMGGGGRSLMVITIK